jgi:hypothetical protein
MIVFGDMLDGFLCMVTDDPVFKYKVQGLKSKEDGSRGL